MSRDELQELRARAYGPGADIDQDAAALRRLHELESLNRDWADAEAGAPASQPPPSGPIVVRVAAPVDEPVPAPIPQTTAAPASEPETKIEPGSEGPQKRRLSRGVKILWALSVAASAAAAAAITFGLTYIAPVNVSSGAEQIATLEPAATIELPTGWMGAGPSSRVYEFYGLTLFETTGGFYGPMGTDCFAAVVTESIPEADSATDNWSYDGMMYSDCRMGDFPAAVEVPVGSGSPADVRSQFPEDSVLQFVMDGDRIGVFLDSDQPSD
ncbi:MAG: hypothetical protein WBX17_14145 [Microbacterium sp.]